MVMNSPDTDFSRKPSNGSCDHLRNLYLGLQEFLSVLLAGDENSDVMTGLIIPAGRPTRRHSNLWMFPYPVDMK
jgi:hypothetical protein